MAHIEIETFKLGAGVTRAAFTAADQARQTKFSYQRPGLMRRTTAVSAEGQWLVVTWWGDEVSYAAAASVATQDEVVAGWSELIDLNSYTSRRYDDIGG